MGVMEDAERVEPASVEEWAAWLAANHATARGVWLVNRRRAVDQVFVPNDLAAALDARPGAREHWASFPPSAQKEALKWIVTAKKPETRAARVEACAESSARGERPR